MASRPTLASTATNNISNITTGVSPNRGRHARPCTGRGSQSHRPQGSKFSNILLGITSLQPPTYSSTMDQWRYRHRPNPKAGIIARVEDFGIEPSAKTEGDECSSPRDSFGRPLLKSSEDDIFAEVPRKGSNMTATDTIGDNQPTARPPTFVPKAFTWSTITAGPKVRCE